MTDIHFDDGSSLTPSKIIGVGRNYSEHIKEMKSEKPDDPVLFIKPATSLCSFYKPIVIPENMGEVHHEIELAVAIGKKCKNISGEKAAEYIAGFGIALDLTLRDVQSVAKKKGLPWAVAKGFDNSCPVSTFYKKTITDVKNLDILLFVNGQLRQSGNLNQMIFSIEELVSYISGIFTLLPGDIILTGTPSGVGPIIKGDTLKGEISGLVYVETSVA